MATIGVDARFEEMVRSFARGIQSVAQTLPGRRHRASCGRRAPVGEVRGAGTAETYARPASRRSPRVCSSSSRARSVPSASSSCVRTWGWLRLTLRPRSKPAGVRADRHARWQRVPPTSRARRSSGRRSTVRRSLSPATHILATLRVGSHPTLLIPRNGPIPASRCSPLVSGAIMGSQRTHAAVRRSPVGPPISRRS